MTVYQATGLPWMLDAGCLEWHAVLGSRQITDCHLLALAVRCGGCLVTFDRRIATAVVPGAGQRNLVLVE